MTLTRGWKTYAAAAGLALLAIANFASGDSSKGIEYALAALGLFGIRHALTSATAPSALPDASDKPASKGKSYRGIGGWTLLALLSLPAAASAQAWEFPRGVPLKAAEVTFHKPTDSYQDFSNVSGGVFWRYNNVSANRAERYGNANRELPWKTGGLDDAPNGESFLFHRFPRGGEIAVWRGRGYAKDLTLGGTNWRIEVHPGVYRWSYPDGTLFGEVLRVDGRTFEVRTMTLKSGKWTFQVYRPFARYAEVAALVKERHQYVGRLVNPHPVKVLDETALLDDLTLNPADVAAVLSRPFRDVTDVVWAERPEGKAYAPYASKRNQLVPAGYQGAYFSSATCVKCHGTAGKNVSEFQPGRDWYGAVRGGGNAAENVGVFSFDIFDPACAGREGAAQVPIRLRTDLPLVRGK
jgi:hypothetical protein